MVNKTISCIYSGILNWEKFYESSQYGLENIPSSYSNVARCQLIEWPHGEAPAAGQKMLRFQSIRFMHFCQSVHRDSQSSYEEGPLLECGKMLFSFQIHIPLQSAGSSQIAKSFLTWHWEHPRAKVCSLPECQRYSITFYLNDFVCFVFPNLFKFIWDKFEVDFSGGASMCHRFPRVQNCREYKSVYGALMRH